MPEEIEPQPEEKQDTSEVGVEQSHFTTPPRWSEKLRIHHKFLPAGRQDKILAGILGVFVFVGVVFGAYKFVQIRRVQPTPQPTATPIVSPIPDQTADWKTYTNTKYGYLIKYPSEWFLNVEAKYEMIVEVLNYELKPGESIQSEVGKGSFGVTIASKDFDQPSFKSWKEYFEESRERAQREGGGGSIPEFLKETTISGLSAAKTNHPMPGVLSGDTIGYFVNRGNILYEITFSFGAGENETTELGKTFNLMLSTFRFINEESVGEKVLCEDPRPELCTMECIVNPPYICGSDEKSYCSECQACAKPDINWYVIQDEPCEAE